MFGFQRVADIIWAAGDQCSRGFLLGATAGRTTLNGEGLQHEDGHSQFFAATVPNCVCSSLSQASHLPVIRTKRQDASKPLANFPFRTP